MLKNIAEYTLIHWSRKLFNTISFIYKALLYCGILIWIIAMYFLLMLHYDGNYLSSKDYVSFLKNFIIDQPILGIIFNILFLLGLINIYFTSCFYKKLAKLLKDLFSFRYERYDLFGLIPLLKSITAVLEKIFFIDIMSIIISEIADYTFNFSKINFEENKSFYVSLDLIDYIDLSVFAVLIFYILFSVITELIDYRYKDGEKIQNLENEQQLVV